MRSIAGRPARVLPVELRGGAISYKNRARSELIRGNAGAPPACDRA
jgi:hypothetical protein